MHTKKIYLYDTTLRDGAQTRGIDFSVKDKKTIAGWLDNLGVSYIEGGWPGANPTDTEFFASPPETFNAKLAAFGMTRKPKNGASEDAGLCAVINSKASAVCLVGKCWDYHATSALGVTLEENIELIRSSVSEAVNRGKEALFDAEHFFDGYKANPSYSLACLKAAYDAGARWLVLCDTNGGTLPHEIHDIVSAVSETVMGENLGIHCHNDTGNAVANSIAAVMAGCRMVQGTLNGLGERCGNADLISLIPTLKVKMGFDVGVGDDAMRGLTKLSRDFDALLDRDATEGSPYVGISAFAHKGGLHASAVAKNPCFYEHIAPDLVGNSREILMSNQAGQSNVKMRLKDFVDDFDESDRRLPGLLEKVKKMEHEGYAYDRAAGSFAVLALRYLKRLPESFAICDFNVHDSGARNAEGEIEMQTRATVRLTVGEKEIITAADGNGPVHALDCALREALMRHFPELSDVKLTDYHVRILDTGAATGAKTRVMLESEDSSAKTKWVTVGVSTNIINASLQALTDSYLFRLGVRRQ